jgi:hypothetical protein
VERTDEQAVRGLLRAAFGAAGGAAPTALRLAMTKAGRAAELTRAIHGGLQTGMRRRLVREELVAGGSFPSGRCADG